MIIPQWAHTTLITTLLSSDLSDPAPTTLLANISTSVFPIPIAPTGIITSLPTGTTPDPAESVVSIVSSIGDHTTMIAYMEKRSLPDSESLVLPSMDFLPATGSTLIIQSPVSSPWTLLPIASFPTPAIPTYITSAIPAIPTPSTFPQLPLSNMPTLGARAQHQQRSVDSESDSTESEKTTANVSNLEAIKGHGSPQNNEYSASDPIAVACNSADATNTTCSRQSASPIIEGGLGNVTNSTSIDLSDDQTENSTSQKSTSGSSGLFSYNALPMFTLGTLMVVTEIFFVFFA